MADGTGSGAPHRRASGGFQRGPRRRGAREVTWARATVFTAYDILQNRHFVCLTLPSSSRSTDCGTFVAAGGGPRREALLPSGNATKSSVRFPKLNTKLNGGDSSEDDLMIQNDFYGVWHDGKLGARCWVQPTCGFERSVGCGKGERRHAWCWSVIALFWFVPRDGACL